MSRFKWIALLPMTDGSDQLIFLVQTNPASERFKTKALFALVVDVAPGLP